MNLDDYITKAEAQRQLGISPNAGGWMNSVLDALSEAGLVTWIRFNNRYLMPRKQFEDVKRHYRPHIRRSDLIAKIREDRMARGLQEVAE